MFGGFLTEHLGDKSGLVVISREPPWAWCTFDKETTWTDLSKHLETLRRSTHDSFCANNSEPPDPEASTRLVRPVRFLSEADRERLFSAGGGWKRFDETYPGARGIFWHSAIGMSTDGQ